MSPRAQAILDWLPKSNPMIGAEIGVHMGVLSWELLSARPLLTLLMVDPWAEFEIHGAPDNYGQRVPKVWTAEHMEGAHRAAVQRVRFAEERAVIARMTSVEAAEGTADGALDFVFIDADHTYAGCKTDIAAWLPKIKTGGFVSGHDHDWPGVAQAAHEMFGDSVQLGLETTWFVRL